MEPAREEYWQRVWADRGLARAQRVPGREKFFALVAYPGASGFLHVGHLRGLVYADAFHRFHRMRGRQVFFPTGTHASGLPAVTFAQRLKERDATIVAQLEQHGVPREEWSRLEDPGEAAAFLGQSYLGLFRRTGLLVDESAYLTTIDEDYQAFIAWQFKKLKDRSALVQLPHFAAVCPVCGPVSVDPSETDLSSGGDAEWLVYHTVPFHLDDGRVLLAATLRPETVFGATNVWVHPTATLRVWHHDGTSYLVGDQTAHRLVEQHGGKLGHVVAAADVIRRTAAAPLAGTTVPVLPSALVDPSVGTGVVMSVPAHAPADWLAVGELDDTDRALIPAIPEIVDLPGPETLAPSEAALMRGAGPPAERAVRATGAGSLADEAAVEEATERLYRLEFSRGTMRRPLLDGLPVPAARDRVVDELSRKVGGFALQEFSKPVICRNGHEVVIRKVPDQWFIHYGDPAWKDRVRALVSRMRFYPAEYGEELPSIVDWLDDRPCVRRGRWLGTPFPFDPSWVIEPIADSTFYPAYFVVRRFVREGRLTVRQLTEAFFDQVFLGEGPGEPSVAPELAREVRAEFTYWYPLDINIGGKEHKRVHFPVFIATHALLLPEELQPRSVFVHWWLTDKGGAKISKKQVLSKGGSIPPVRESFERWGADALRLYHTQTASPSQDFEWEPGQVDGARARVEEMERLYRDLSVDGGGGSPELDAWLESEWHELVGRATEAMEGLSVRSAAELIYSRAPAVFRRYIARGGAPGPMLRRALAAWVRLLSPVTPHMAEELGAAEGSTLVAERSWPEPSEFARHPAALAAEAYLVQVEEDLRNVLKLAEARGEKARAVEFYVAAPWKRTVERWIRDETRGGRPIPPLRELMTRAESHAELAAFRPQIPKYYQRVAASVRAEPEPSSDLGDERRILEAAGGYLARRFNLEEVAVYPEEQAEAHDRQNRRERARPGRPAFFAVIPGASSPRDASGSGPATGHRVGS